MNAVSKFETVLSKYLPKDAAIVEYIIQLLNKYPLQFKIVKPRKTKLGDFRWRTKEGISQITVNGDLNPYSFMLTTIHEIAHFFAFTEHGRYIKPHGKEWQQTFSSLLKAIPNLDTLPNDVQLAIKNYSIKPKASSCTDIKLYRVLSRYDEKNDDHIRIEMLPVGSHFSLNEIEYVMLSKARTRYLCLNKKNNKKYKIHALAQVKPTK